MKRALIFSFYFPPQPEAGSLRSGYLADRLRGYGWEPTIITVPYRVTSAKNYRIVHAWSPLTPALRATRPEASALSGQIDRSSKGRIGIGWAQLRRVIANFYYRWYPDPAVGWIPDALRHACRLHREAAFSVVFSTAWPASAHLAAAAFSRLYDVPWVADYRDLWTDNPYRTNSHSRKLLDTAVESRVLKHAAAITTVSEGLRKSLATLHQRDDVQVIANASAREDWAGIPDGPPQQFNVLYAGMLYSGRRSPDILFAAAGELRAEGHPAAKELTFDFYGSDPDPILASAERYGVREAVRIHGRVEREKILEYERRSAVLLIMLAMDSSLADEYGSKLYEYAGACRPILALGPEQSVVRDYLVKSGLGRFASTIVECKEALRAMYARYAAGCYEPALASDWKPFTADDLAARFVEIFDRIVSR